MSSFSRHWSAGPCTGVLGAALRRTAPSSPDRTSAIAARLNGSNWQRYATISLTCAARHASIISRASAEVFAIGFSHSTCSPAAAAARTCARCSAFGVTT